MSSASQKVQESNDQTAIRAVLESVAKAHVGMKTNEIQAWLDTWEGPIEREVRDLKIAVTGDFALVHGYYRLGGTPKSAGRPISFWMRATMALRREENGWQIVHEHVSVPFYMDGSLRPAFDLQP